MGSMQSGTNGKESNQVSLNSFTSPQSFAEEVFVDQSTRQIIICSQEETQQGSRRASQLRVDKYVADKDFNHVKHAVNTSVIIATEGSPSHEFYFVDGSRFISWTRQDMFVYCIDRTKSLRVFPVLDVMYGPIHVSVFGSFLVVISATCIQIGNMPNSSSTSTPIQLHKIYEMRSSVLAFDAATCVDDGDDSSSRASTPGGEEETKPSFDEMVLKVACLCWDNVKDCYLLSRFSFSYLEMMRAIGGEQTARHDHPYYCETFDSRSWTFDFLPNGFEDDICASSWIDFNPCGDHIALLIDSHLVVVSLQHNMFDHTLSNYRSVVGWIGNHLLSFAVEGKHGIMKSKVHYVSCDQYMDMYQSVQKGLRSTQTKFDTRSRTSTRARTRDNTSPTQFCHLTAGSHHRQLSYNTIDFFAESNDVTRDDLSFVADSPSLSVSSMSFSSSAALSFTSSLSLSSSLCESVPPSLANIGEVDPPMTPRDDAEELSFAVETIAQTIASFVGRACDVEWTVERGTGRGARFSSFHFGKKLGMLGYALNDASHPRIRILDCHAIFDMIYSLRQPNKMAKLYDDPCDEFYVHSFRESRIVSNWKPLVW